MLKKTIIYLFIASNSINLSANQTYTFANLSSRSSIDKQLEQDYQRREREREERNRKLEEDYQRREEERKERNRKLEEAHQRREKERQYRIQQILSDSEHPDHAILLNIQQATQDFYYFSSNHKALINNYKKVLQKHSMKLQGTSYTLLKLISKFNHICSYDHQHYSYQEKGEKSYNDRKIMFYIGTEGLRMQCVDIINLRKKVEGLIADEMKQPCSQTKKAKKAFNYLKKRAKKEKKLDQPFQATEEDMVRGRLGFFKKLCGHLDFEHTQTGSFVFPYMYFIELAKIVKSYQNKVNISKRAKNIQS